MYRKEKSNTDKKKATQEKPAEQVFNALGLGGLINALKESSPLLKERLETANQQIKENLAKGIIAGVKPEIKTHFSIRPILRERMEFKRAPKTVRVRFTEKAPLIEVFEEKNQLRITAEFPEMQAGQIKTSLKDRQLFIQAGNYRKTLQLPCAVKKIVKKTFTNHVLEITLKKA